MPHSTRRTSATSPTRSPKSSASSLLLALALAGGAPAALAQGLTHNADGWELGGRYWWSVGRTAWSHNAQGSNPTFGNPTSVLVYDKLYAHSLEFTGAKRWRQGWFITGYAGLGKIYRGNLNDSDYNVGQVKFSETNSSITDGYLAYLTVDGGHDLWRSASGSSFGLFGGLQLWNEEVEASGLSYVVRPSGQRDIGPGTKVITNNMTWLSVRTGVTARIQATEKMRFLLTAAAVPFTHLYNQDSHHLRSDLGSTPNITMSANGYGYQLDAEARYAITRNTELGLGFRYWRLTAEGDIHFAGGRALPLKEFESTRRGVTAAFVRRW